MSPPANHDPTRRRPTEVGSTSLDSADARSAPYATTYLPLFIYRNAFEYLRYGYAAAATLVMFVVTAVIVVVQYRIVRRWRKAFIV